jgi:AcrR family transcriptional regulator
VPDSRREVILDAAARLFAARGYSDVSIDEIGTAVEASGPSLYWHFPNKAALLEAVAVTAAERFAAAIEATGPNPTLDAIARAEVGAVLDRPHYVRTLLLERHRITSGHEAITAAEARNTSVAAPAVKRLNPDLNSGQVAVRVFTQLGPLSLLTVTPPALPRTRLEDLTSRSIVALAATPPAPRGSPRPRGTWQPARSRPEAILHAARELFRARRYEDIGLRDVAEAAGLSRPSVYHYFRNKGEILDEAWRRELTRFLVGTWDALDQATSADDALDRLAAAYTSVVLDCIDILGVIQRRPLDAPDLHRESHQPQRRQVADAWASVLGELRPDLSASETRLVVDMALNVAAWGAVAAGGNHAWHPEITAMTTAFARG